MFVKDHMSVPPLTVRSDTDYKAALRLMQEHAVHHVPVLDAAGELTGILTERDLLIAAARYLQSGVDVADVMHRDVVTVTPETTLGRAAGLLASHKIGGLPVVDGHGKVVGVITETDMLIAFVEILGDEGGAVAQGRPGAARKASSRPAPGRA